MTSIGSVQSSAAANAADPARSGAAAKAAAPAKEAASAFDLDDLVDISEAGRKRLREVAG